MRVNLSKSLLQSNVPFNVKEIEMSDVTYGKFYYFDILANPWKDSESWSTWI